MDQNQYNTTKLAFANLGVEMARMEALKETGSISQQAYDQMKLSYDQTEESLDFLKKNTYYTAPFSGVITAKNYEEGELYGGQPILVLTQISTLKAFISVPESYFTLVKSGMQVELSTQIFVISNGTDSRYFANTTERNKNSFDFTMNWAKADNSLIKDRSEARRVGKECQD